jgi:hypothetical protein
MPDGLESVASALGFDHKAVADPLIRSPLPDYGLPAEEPTGWGTIIAGIVGALGVFALSSLLAQSILPKKRPGQQEFSPPNQGLR